MAMADDRTEQLRKAAIEGGHARAEALSREERREIARAAAVARWGKEGEALPRAIKDGVLQLADATFPCAVIEGETRVLAEMHFMQGMGMYRSGALSKRRPTSGAHIPLSLAHKNLKPFIEKHLGDVHFQPLKYRTTTGNVAHGIRAEAIPRICRVWVDASQAGVLGARQQEIARKATMVLAGLAEVGIIALVDEATGYQDQRAHDALAKILEKFVAKELAPYIKTFPPDFYKEIYRLRGWTYPPRGNRHNSNLGKLTNDLVYDRLAPGVRDELHRLTPRRPSGRLKHKLFQRLTPEFGHPKLREHLGATVMAMKLSDDWVPFMRTINRVLPKHPRIEDKHGQRNLQLRPAAPADED
jgi:hypothetical protein